MTTMKARTLTTLLIAGVVALALTGCKKNIRDDSVTTPPSVSSKMDEGELLAVSPGEMGELSRSRRSRLHCAYPQPSRP